MGKSSWKDVRVDGKVMVITGASAGLGKASAVDLARRGAKVYMLGRSKERTEAAAADVVTSSGVEPAMVNVMVVDLASLTSIRNFAAEFKKREPKIDVLMNNAGVMMLPQGKTEDGYETQFATNVLGPFLLTHLLMDQLVAAAPGSRVINLSSLAHEMGLGDVQWDDVMMEKNYSGHHAYCQSKLCDVLFNLELSKRVRPAGITCYAVHPGAVATNLQAGAEDTVCWIRVMLCCCRPCFKKPDDGAKTQVMCAVDPAIADDTGYYYANCKRDTPSRQARNEESARRLWDMCAEYVKLQPSEIHSLLQNPSS